MRSICLLLLSLTIATAWIATPRTQMKISSRTISTRSSTALLFADEKEESKTTGEVSTEEPEKEKKPKRPYNRWIDGWKRIQIALKMNEKRRKILDEKFPNRKQTGILYTPGSYPNHVLAALAYIVPIIDSYDLGKYIFQAYPDIAEVYNTFFGGAVAVYNGVPFLSFVIFFVLSYIARAPSFPTEIRFHFSQAFILSLIQFLPSLTFGFFEKAGVPGMAYLYNTVFVWMIFSSVVMQWALLNPFASKTTNPFLLPIAQWSKDFMQYDRIPRDKR